MDNPYLVGVVSAAAAPALIALVVYLWTRTRSRLRRRTHDRAIAESTSGHQAMFLYLTERYGAGGGNDLYTTRRLAPGTQIPHFSPATWHAGPYSPAELFDFSEYRRLPPKHDKAVLAKFALRVPMTHKDGSPWNDEILVAVRVTPAPTIVLARSDYFSFLSEGGALQLELESYIGKRRRRTPIRDRTVATTTSLADGSIHNPVGANVVTLVHIHADEDRPRESRVLLQKRANNVAVSPGLHNVVPSFQILAPEGVGDVFDIRDDLIREYLEELFNFDDVIHTADRKQASRHWYLGEPEARALSDGLRDGRHRFEILGMGIDLVHGGLHLACLLELSSSREDFYRLTANWEGKIYDCNLGARELDDLVLAHEFEPDATFALDLARQRLIDIHAPSG